MAAGPCRVRCFPALPVRGGACQCFALFMRDAIVIFHKFADKTLGEIPIDTGKLKTYTEEKIVTGSNGEKYEANHS